MLIVSVIGHLEHGGSLASFPPSTLTLAIPPVLSNRNPPIPPVSFSLAANSLLIPNRPRSGWEDETQGRAADGRRVVQPSQSPSTRTPSRTAVARLGVILSRWAFSSACREACNCKMGSADEHIRREGSRWSPSRDPFPLSRRAGIYLVVLLPTTVGCHGFSPFLPPPPWSFFIQFQSPCFSLSS